MIWMEQLYTDRSSYDYSGLPLNFDEIIIDIIVFGLYLLLLISVFCYLLRNIRQHQKQNYIIKETSELISYNCNRHKTIIYIYIERERERY